MDAVRISQIDIPRDPDVALDSLMFLVWASHHLKRFDLAKKALQAANQRFPGRAWLLLHETNITVGRVNQVGLDSTNGHDLLREAVELALRSRDCFRLWDGPSHHAVALAAQALLALEDPQRAVMLASAEPDGEATPSEAGDPDVRSHLATAYLMLGRHDDVDLLRIEGIDPFKAAMIRAQQALGVGDKAAPSLMRRALDRADDDPSRRRALRGLAAAGEVDEAAMSDMAPADAVLLRGVAAFTHDDLVETINTLKPYRFESPYHASYMALAQHQLGSTHEAVKTLTDAAEQLGDVSLFGAAAELLMKQGKFSQAQSVVTDALARDSLNVDRHHLRKLLVSIADRLEEWQTMESYAKALAREFPQDTWAAWMVVYALHCQRNNRDAYAYLTENKLEPISEDMARLEVAVRSAVDIPEQDAERLLEIAGMYADAEDIAGPALVALLTRGDRIRFNEEQRLRRNELADDFFVRYPQSHILQSHSAERPEEILEKLVSPLRADAERHGTLINNVRYGRLPYGALRWIRELPYAEVLMSRAAGWLTAISIDEDQRDRERQTALEAMGGTVVVDTSVVALGVASGLELDHLAKEFKTVLVADELISDARAAVASTQEPVTAVVGYDPVLRQPTMTEIDESQQQVMIEMAKSILKVLSRWRRINSSRLVPLTDLGEKEEYFKPWDASIRVALDKKCALWCDDLALRNMAELEGIPTFGTWALHEALHSTQKGKDLPTATETKMLLLRARIADVPISLDDLAQAADDSDGPDIAVQCFLSRPHTWNSNPSDTYRWYLERVRTMSTGAHRQRIPSLLLAACHGWGAAVPATSRTVTIGGVLAATLLIVGDPALTPVMLAATRYATNELDPGVGPDPLPDVLHHLLKNLEPGVGTETAAQQLTTLFSGASPADRRTVTSIVLGDR